MGKSHLLDFAVSSGRDQSERSRIRREGKEWERERLLLVDCSFASFGRRVGTVPDDKPVS